MDWLDWTQVATMVAGVAVTGFVIAYTIIARWWRTQEGQNVVLLSVLILAAASIGFLRRLGFPDLANVLAALVWTGVAVSYVWMTGLLFRAQGVHRMLNRRRRRPADQDRTTS